MSPTKCVHLGGTAGVLEQCAYISAEDEEGSTPLLLASGGHYFKDGSVLLLLLERGADINVQNRIGLAPFHWASINGALEVVRLLLEHGADVEEKYNDGDRMIAVCGYSVCIILCSWSAMI
jgi:ankyrin repeat protein